MEVEDIPFVRRRYTWYRSNSHAKSWLDRFLVSKEWMIKWQGSTQYVLNRSCSHRCPIVLKNNYIDWGPKLFKVFNCWFMEMVLRKKWRNCGTLLISKKEWLCA